ncbi:fibrinogen silencer-binding protein-like [Aphis craccivora]|uniref:Fibrinogen silencer-binding protein-like n=1 Tax=Aphis craccivora TaxID=307492 RepID=A0A6G0YEV6_APHCR|nr:fibrinogen silencer-binding protein-like [Aphis craccivora]
MKTHSVNVKKKKDAWTKNEAKFNCQCIDNPRSAAVLKNKYENIKRSTNKQYADENAHHGGTGGGPSKLFNSPSLNLTYVANQMTPSISPSVKRDWTNYTPADLKPRPTITFTMNPWLAFFQQELVVNGTIKGVIFANLDAIEDFKKSWPQLKWLELTEHSKLFLQL